MSLVRNFANGCPTCGQCCVTGCHGQEIRCVYCNGCCCATFEAILGPNQSLFAGTIMAQRDDNGLYYPYNPSSDNGLDYPRGILRRTFQTDENSRISTYNVPLIGSVCGMLGANIFYEGTFRTRELFGNVAAAIGNPSFGRLIEGSISNGILKLA